MMIELVPETREEKIQHWTRKIDKKIAREKADINRLYDSDIAEDQKMAKLMADSIYMSVPEDIRDDVYDMLDAEADTGNGP